MDAAMPVIKEAIRVTWPFTKPVKYKTDDLIIEFFDPENFQNEVQNFCQRYELESSPLPDDVIPQAIPVYPNGILINAEIIDSPEVLFYVTVSSVLHLYFMKAENDVNIDELIGPSPEEITEDALEHFDLLSAEQKAAIYRRDGYAIWSLFLAEYVTSTAILQEAKASEVSDSIVREPDFYDVAEHLVCVFTCPEYVIGKPGKGVFVQDISKLPYQAMIQDIANQLNKEKYYELTAEFLYNLGRDYNDGRNSLGTYYRKRSTPFTI